MVSDLSWAKGYIFDTFLFLFFGWDGKKEAIAAQCEKDYYVWGNGILSIWNEMEKVNFMVQIKYYKSNSVQFVTSFKILNKGIVCTSLDSWDKI